MNTENSFIADGMLGKLSRWLRILGCDVDYRRDESDSALVLSAKSSHRTLLTGDEALYKQSLKNGAEAFLVEGQNNVEKLANVARRFSLNLKLDVLTSRCPVCNAHIKEIAPRHAENLVPPATFRRYRQFWVCTNSRCRKTYWRGSHWSKIKKILEEAERFSN